MSTATLHIEKKKRLVPKLRFPEFEESWFLNQLDAIVDKKISYGIVQAGEHVENGMPYIKSQNLNNEINLFELQRTSDEIAKKYQRSEVKPGDIVFSLRGNIGVSRIVPSSIEVANLTQGTARISVSNLFYNRFINFSLQINFIVKQVSEVSKGSTFQEISLEALRKIKIFTPTLSEQQKIASFLSAVDEKMQQLSRKKELLEQYKKGVMQQLFSGKLRFKDENGKDYADWEEKKLGEVCEIAKSGGTPTSTNREYYNGDIPFLSISDMTSQGKYLNYTTNHISKLGLDNSSSWIVPANSIIYSMYASVGFVAINKIPLATSQAVLNLILKKGISTDFMYYKLVDFQKEIAQFITTGTQGNLNAQSVKNFKIELPSLQEQKKIADFLSSIDAKLESTSQQINQMQSFKKGLLQQMFV